MDGFDRAIRTEHLTEHAAAAQRILDVQTPDGAIPWFEDGPWDPWNHVECAMALTAMGELEAADAAFDYLVETQRPDGAWLGEYGNALPMDERNERIKREAAPAFLDTNFCAYPAVGVMHRLLATGDLTKAREVWPTVRAAIDFILSLQRPDGAISWSVEALGTDEDDALLAGNASIAKSLDCAIALADRLGERRDPWRHARRRLGEALRTRVEAFDRRGRGERFAMDWYYPILSGALDKAKAAGRLREGWTQFVHPDFGCRCVIDEPWMTVAETSELVMALLALGERETARRMLDLAVSAKDETGVYWMGWQFEEEIYWPLERPTWTQAAVILAADALWGRTPSSRLLTSFQITAGA